MSLIDVFLSIFIGTLLFDFVAKKVVSLYMDIKEQLRKKEDKGWWIRLPPIFLNGGELR